MNEAEQVGMVLAAAKLNGHPPFDSVWYRALRALVPPADCPDALRDDHEDMKAILRETKPHWRAAYESRLPTEQELEDGMRHARRRLRDLLLSEAESEREA